MEKSKQLTYEIAYILLKQCRGIIVIYRVQRRRYLQVTYKIHPHKENMWLTQISPCGWYLFLVTSPNKTKASNQNKLDDRKGMPYHNYADKGNDNDNDRPNSPVSHPIIEGKTVCIQWQDTGSCVTRLYLILWKRDFFFITFNASSCEATQNLTLKGISVSSFNKIPWYEPVNFCITRTPTFHGKFSHDSCCWLRICCSMRTTNNEGGDGDLLRS